MEEQKPKFEEIVMQCFTELTLKVASLENLLIKKGIVSEQELIEETEANKNKAIEFLKKELAKTNGA